MPSVRLLWRPPSGHKRLTTSYPGGPAADSAPQAGPTICLQPLLQCRTQRRTSRRASRAHMSSTARRVPGPPSPQPHAAAEGGGL